MIIILPIWDCCCCHNALLDIGYFFVLQLELLRQFQPTFAKMHNFLVEKYIGEGAFGTVLKCLHQTN